jgi:hypothetical protein
VDLNAEIAGKFDFARQEEMKEKDVIYQQHYFGSDK